MNMRTLLLFPSWSLPGTFLLYRRSNKTGLRQHNLVRCCFVPMFICYGTDNMSFPHSVIFDFAYSFAPLVTSVSVINPVVRNIKGFLKELDVSELHVITHRYGKRRDSPWSFFSSSSCISNDASLSVNCSNDSPTYYSPLPEFN
ncbi:MAG: hypothetical protein MZV63_15740 [Marinilabiliales bacterium]|nr:hypothetical protein [Marinilabiliales bacterium]